jgi:putative hydrolase of HD superfamily
MKESDFRLEKITDTNIQNIVKFLEIAGILKRIPRTGWVEVGVYQPESVADHTFRTAIFCMLYADMESLDSLKLLRMALIHDLPEAIIGDFTPSEKTAETKEKEETEMKQILNLLPLEQRERYITVWNEYQEGKTREAQAVRQLEKIEMALQAKEYQKAGSTSKSLERFIKSAEEATLWPELRRLLSLVSEERKHEL